MTNILVYALHHEGAVNKNSLGAISTAAKLAEELGGEAHALFVGEDIADDTAGTVGTYGAKKAFRVKAPAGIAQPIVDALDAVVESGDYGYVVFGGGLLGFEAGAGLAARRGGGIGVEITGLRVEDGKIVAERPVLGDSEISDIAFEGIGIIAARLNAFEPVESGSPISVEDVDVTLSDAAGKLEVVTRGEQRGADVNIEDATILVTGGRGLGSAENFSVADGLAAAFGGSAAVAATRAAVDAGWFPYAGQIGQTGKTVAPKLYLGLGVSGAIQHKVGMQSSDAIVAINKDSNAPIFEFADLGVVGDLHSIVPALAEAIKAKKG
ncbi:electron transfer flavoprotein subunit alpha/FixB family protein [Patulibacter sp.]|uniref:electron transfer flavoprotein subunit alpha/FixB family protein n=1 Tax=Patulibacter sp. TaxID=1912859 RepID=UPI0027181FE0|nr:electron transfer flavoprotein subunit alpha/FixB family protein [Patulibacter sp.]MDO9408520.1 electron transfer flavoprotein subunit alpha/FixB family protein [Patulibacter sp.]